MVIKGSLPVCKMDPVYSPLAPRYFCCGLKAWFFDNSFGSYSMLACADLVAAMTSVSQTGRYGPDRASKCTIGSDTGQQ